MTNQSNIVAFPFQPQALSDCDKEADLFWSWKMKATSYLNDCRAQGIEPHDEVKETIREINGYLVDSGYEPLVIDF